MHALLKFSMFCKKVKLTIIVIELVSSSIIMFPYWRSLWQKPISWWSFGNSFSSILISSFRVYKQNSFASLAEQKLLATLTHLLCKKSIRYLLSWKEEALITFSKHISTSVCPIVVLSLDQAFWDHEILSSLPLPTQRFWGHGCQQPTVSGNSTKWKMFISTVGKARYICVGKEH